MTYEGLRLKVLEVVRKTFSKSRNKKITNKDFTIISNNCWGGMIYESYNLPKNSPTVGLFFYADDYIKFLKDLKKYISKPLTFIKPEFSKWKKFSLNDNRFGSYPIGKIDDIEIFFLHYHSETEAKEKWERRCKRINWNNLIVKFNDQNLCNQKNVNDFFELPFENKLFFTVKNWNINDKYYKFNQLLNKKFIKASYEPFGKNRVININKYINNLKK